MLARPRPCLESSSLALVPSRPWLWDNGKTAAPCRWQRSLPRLVSYPGVSGIASDCRPMMTGCMLERRHNHTARRPLKWGKTETGLTQPLILSQAYHNFVLSHASLRQPLSERIATNGTTSAKMWRARTPAMAAGLTEHVWSLREVLLFRVPPWPQPQVR
jgi:hypothetical protein